MKLYNADSIVKLKELEENSIDSIVTDPPYFINFMNKKWDAKEHIASHPDFWTECLRVLKPGGHVLAFGHSRTHHRLFTAIEDAGFQIKDTIMWMYGSGFPKSHNIGKSVDALQKTGKSNPKALKEVEQKHGGESYKLKGKNNGIMGETVEWERKEYQTDTGWEGWGTALKPSIEIVAHAQKPFTVVPFCAILDEVDNNIKELLCLLQSSAKYAPTSSRSSQSELGEAVSDSVLCPADEKRGKQLDEPNEKTDTSNLLETERTVWNTEKLWNNILVDLYKKQNTFTTEITTNLITHLQILNLSILENTQAFTTPVEIPTVGSKLDALPATKSLTKEKIKQTYTQIITALADALLKIKIVSERTDAKRAICLAQKPREGTYANNVLKHGVGGINIDACRIGSNEDFSHVKPRTMMKNTGSVAKSKKEGKEHNHEAATSLQAAKEKLQNLGRFPANVILTHHPDCKLVGEAQETFQSSFAGTKGGVYNTPGSPSGWQSGDHTEEIKTINPVYECVEGCPIKELDTQAPKVGNAFKAKRKKDTTGGTGDSWKTDGKKEGEDNGKYDGLSGASRFFYCAKAGKKDRNKYTPEELRNHHPTVKPLKLMNYLIKLVTPAGGTVLDPFMGSGSTGITALEGGWDFIGIEKDKEYYEIAKARLNNVEEKIV